MQVKKLKRSCAGSVIPTAGAIVPVIERLEDRRLFAVTLGTAQTPVLAHPSSPATDAIDLSQQFTDPQIVNGITLTGTIVQFRTNQGDIDVHLTDAQTPNTVANFLGYLNSGAYANTFFHRSVVLSTNKGGIPSAPSDIVQGGGYKLVKNTAKHIPTNATVADEYTGELEGDLAGTLAMAKTSQANSATSEFFFNVHSNVSALDTPTTDSSGVTTSYTVFGVVLGNGINVMDALAALPTSSVGKSLTTVPVTGVPVANIAKAHIYASNLVYLENVSVIPALTYSAVSDNPQLVNPIVKGTSLSFQYASGKTGVANITVTATGVDGTTATETFAVTVPNTAAPTASIVASADSQTITQATTTTLTPLTNDTDSLAPINPATLVIFAQPAHGTATANTTTGTISYVPTAGYSGADSLQYTVADTAGAVSTATTISLNVSPAIQVTVGTGGESALDYTQPNGAVARLTVTNGSAVVTFANSQVDVIKNGTVANAKGAGATISNIAITASGAGAVSLNMTGSGTTTVGSITGAGSIKAIVAPQTELTGSLSVSALGELVLSSTNQALLTIGGGMPVTNILISIATDTSVAATSALTIRSKQWLNSDGLDDTITAASVNALTVAGEFDNDLDLTSAGVSLQNASIGGNLTGTWTIDGSVTSMSAKSAGAAWSLSSVAAATNISFKGNLAGSISALTIGKLSVGGSITGGTITATASTPLGLDVGKLFVHGALTNSQIIAGGNVGTVEVASLAGSQIYAGVTGTVSTAKTLPAQVSDFSQPAEIFTVQVGHTFSNSLIAASTIDHLQLGKIQTNNGGSTEGIAGQKINSLVAALSSGGHLLLGKAQLKSATTLSDYLAKKKITLGDFDINLVS